MTFVQCFLRQQRMGFAMAEVSWRRTDELGNLVRVLELTAINFDAGMRIAEHCFRHGFHYAGLSGPRGSEEKQISDGTSGRIQSSHEHLIDFTYFLDCLVLAGDLAA